MKTKPKLLKYIFNLTNQKYIMYRIVILKLLKKYIYCTYDEYFWNTNGRRWFLTSEKESLLNFNFY